ncbi:hypothetical protein [Paramaledivibacter caminithermalis]|uniref:Uncharacterized protein n=1 Tax=Paramaledivibacter caminithermalis (strain DSM 15212 / CIP 107654 / DViRD3) TaxID=1121301 RepID=A0A1M6TRC7_PARC5|nr:hypothetical protein [Paramaledivibacter caminithermalis]SHK59470.1 hypothetical protein SAMN02745912_03769 [Paramaledivibacter caminithermalis DSM 15212]
MILDKYLYILPITIAIITIAYYMYEKQWRFKIRTMRELKKEGIINVAIDTIKKYTTPKKDGKIYNYYKKRLKYTKWKVENFFFTKVTIILAVVILITLIRITNISIYTDKIFNEYEYKSDFIYSYTKENIDKIKGLKQEIKYLRLILNDMSKKEFKKNNKESIEGKILHIMSKNKEKLEINAEIAANKIYFRLKDYYEIRENNYILYFIITCTIYFIPDVILSIYNIFVKNEAKRELYFLKKLMIVNGSVKPISYLEILEILIEKSKYYKKMLMEIRNLNLRNTIDNIDIYKKHIRIDEDLEGKLFLEKLNQANNVDLDQAINSLKIDFKIQRKQKNRQVRKQVEIIELTGIAGSIIIFTLMTIYMLLIWMKMYNLSEIL